MPVETYELQLTYRDPCYQDRLRLTVYTAGEVAAQICRIGAYEDHWARRHPVTIDGPFPLLVGEFPNRAFIAAAIRGLAIGQRKYLHQSHVGSVSYTAVLRRTG
jgi:hypothetical protein